MNDIGKAASLTYDIIAKAKQSFICNGDEVTLNLNDDEELSARSDDELVQLMIRIMKWCNISLDTNSVNKTHINIERIAQNKTLIMKILCKLAGLPQARLECATHPKNDYIKFINIIARINTLIISGKL